MEKLKSRKLWVTVGIATVGALLTQLGLDADKSQAFLDWLLKLAGTYILGQGAVDAVSVLKK